jgi:four helix bundle protein
MDLVEAVYQVTSGFPKEETYGLTAQLRRAAVSVPSNVAEGQGRRTPGDFGRCLAIAHGSLREVETQLLLSVRLAFLQGQRGDDRLEQAGEVGRLITGLANSLRSRQ